MLGSYLETFPRGEKVLFYFGQVFLVWFGLVFWWAWGFALAKA
jgi:hypothetical protein